MARFFNHKRKSGLESNNWSNYLKYALGEILLVVIGILIALYINNWNEKRKAEIQNTILLEELQNENQINLQDLIADTPYRDTLYTTIYNFREFLSGENFLAQRDSLNSFLTVLSRLNTYEPNDNYLRKYIEYNSDSPSLLSKELVLLYNRNRALKIISDKALELRLEKYLDFIAKDVEFVTLEIIDPNVFGSLEFRNNLILIGSIEEGLYQVFKESMAQQKKVDSLITQVLKNNK